MGFITPDSGAQDIFAHRSELLGAQWLAVGMAVLYEEAWDNTKGKRTAKNVSWQHGVVRPRSQRRGRTPLD
eukprot:12897041-Prorocentrum_lima.AAC.1